LLERNQMLCLRCHFQQQDTPGTLNIGSQSHASFAHGATSGFVSQGVCWSGGCHEAIHGSQVNEHLRY
jgi:hypothetical protein